jgi:hypothetical protein
MTYPARLPKPTGFTFDPTDALCAQVDPELFFPESAGNVSTQIRQAKSICKECPIINDCLIEALTKDYMDGIWGGTTPNERRELKKRYKQVAITKGAQPSAKNTTGGHA